MIRRRLTKEDIRRLEEESGMKASTGSMAIVVEILEWSFYLFILFLLLKFTRPIWQPIYSFISAAL